MRCFGKALLLGVILLFPLAAHAQSIAGMVRDASGAVLPGVTVEAASPALIEKVRTSVTDGSGQFRLENLAPGVYKSPTPCQASPPCNARESSSRAASR
jgi:hypothetical protein